MLGCVSENAFGARKVEFGLRKKGNICVVPEFCFQTDCMKSSEFRKSYVDLVGWNVLDRLKIIEREK